MNAIKSLFQQLLDASTNFVDFADRIGDLDRQGANIERLLTSGVGINAEGGEFLEIIKKMVFQGKLPGTRTTVSILLLSWVIFYGMSLRQQWHWASALMKSLQQT